MTDHEEGEEIAPGVVITRRITLRFGPSAAALGGLGTLPVPGGALQRWTMRPPSPPPARSRSSARLAWSARAVVAEQDT